MWDPCGIPRLNLWFMALTMSSHCEVLGSEPAEGSSVSQIHSLTHSYTHTLSLCLCLSNKQITAEKPSYCLVFPRCNPVHVNCWQGFRLLPSFAIASSTAMLKLYTCEGTSSWLYVHLKFLEWNSGSENVCIYSVDISARWASVNPSPAVCNSASFPSSFSSIACPIDKSEKSRSLFVSVKK